MKRKTLNVFSLSFLDCITCGLGAIILLFVIINAKSAARQETVASDLRAETDMMAQEVLDGKKNFVLLRNSLEETEQELVLTQGMAEEVIQVLRQKKVELADDTGDTLARRQHVNKLKADVKSLEEEVRRLKAGAREVSQQGDKLRTFPGTGDRHYLTDLKMGGRRILILVDASASMLDETVVGVIRRRNLSAAQKLASPKWRQAVATVEWLVSQLPAASQFQIYAFNETPRSLVKGSAGSWLDAGNVEHLDQAVEGMQRVVPEKGTSLLNAFGAIKQMRPAPDNIFLLVDGLPTMGAEKPWRKRVTGKKRHSLFEQARKQLSAGVPVNIILYPMEGDPMAADAYWRLAKKTRGSFFCPAEDWP